MLFSSVPEEVFGVILGPGEWCLEEKREEVAWLVSQCTSHTVGKERCSCIVTTGMSASVTLKRLSHGQSGLIIVRSWVMRALGLGAGSARGGVAVMGTWIVG
jgi:hypothetical protein